MKTKIIIAVLVVSFGFFAWLSQILTPVHPRDPEGVIPPVGILKHGIPIQLP